MSISSDEGVRETKRRHTRRRIIDEALKLMEEQDFDSVTVESICENADISRRTFFNYMNSKDDLVLGAFPPALPPAAHERIATTQTNNVVALVITEIAVNADPIDSGFESRQRRIIAKDKALAFSAMNRVRSAMKPALHSLERHYSNFPEDRVLEHEPVSIEIHFVFMSVMNAVGVYLLHPEFEPTDTASEVDQLLNAAALSARFSKELTW
ncbi:TetR/AcrR family transcriptional regulator [Corynebacterium lubricantis]|uniref:TetR/AcrR family transcriptional regulator n=1 Tax=Corynebacterium lubricantis TaxID=541095 RepID=UPI001461697D|nr:TetR/AcrR family transcriptional regulator [Corynebacterium lubricantis]